MVLTKNMKSITIRSSGLGEIVNTMPGTTEPEGNNEFRGSTILLIDDPAALNALPAYLEQSGLRVLVAANGAAGIKQARKAQPNLILLDVLLPDIHGIEVCRRLKADAATRDIPVIFLAHAIDAQAQVYGLQAGAVDYITRPFQPED